MKEKIQELHRRRSELCMQLIPVARAAANQMKDAGMHRGADPLLEVLFQLDSLDAEVRALVTSDIDGFMKILLGDLRDKGNSI